MTNQVEQDGRDREWWIYHALTLIHGGIPYGQRRGIALALSALLQRQARDETQPQKETE